MKREMEKFEELVKQLEAELEPREHVVLNLHRTRRWPHHAVWFQHTGRTEPHGPTTVNTSGASGPHQSRQPVVDPVGTASTVQQEKGARPVPPELEDHVIDPITNRKIPKSKKAGRLDGTDPEKRFGYKMPDLGPSTNKKYWNQGVPHSGKPHAFESLGNTPSGIMCDSAALAKKNTKKVEAADWDACPPKTETADVPPQPMDGYTMLNVGPSTNKRFYTGDRGPPRLGPHVHLRHGLYPPDESGGMVMSQKRPGTSSITAEKDGPGIDDSKSQPQIPVRETDGGKKLDADHLSKNNESPEGAQLQAKKGAMTGDYVKDFPEDFSGTWTGTYHSETSAEKPASERLEPALNRTGEASAANEADVSPTEPPERTKHDDLVDQIRHIYEAEYGAIESLNHLSSSLARRASHRRAAMAESSGSLLDEMEAEPNLYKILVYDAETETVETTDATSVVPDKLGILTPAEAVTRLSNPAKFLRHFTPLQVQGYEVVSADADVLVFRKTRDATEPGTVFLRGTRYASFPDRDATEPKSAGSVVAPPVNPIDMMGSEGVVPNVGNFASPTGFATYGDEGGGRERDGSRKPPPPFREVGGPEYEGGRGRRGTLWRASVGAAWVAGLLYGGSVVGEYFYTGGENGKGSRGLF